MSAIQVKRSKTYCEFETKLLSAQCVLSTASKKALNVNLNQKKKKQSSRVKRKADSSLSLTQISSLRLLDFAIDFVLLFAHYNFNDYLLKIATQISWKYKTKKTPTKYRAQMHNRDNVV